MEIQDVFTGIILGIVAGIMIMGCYLWGSVLHKIGRLAKSVALLIVPSILWFTSVYGVLFCAGSHVSDSLGMNMLASGIVVFLTSIVTVVVSLLTQKVLPVCCTAIFVATILNSVYVILRM